jgi:hypothetical protein
MKDGVTVFWAIVEMMGHRRLAGRLTEVTLGGAGFLRLDIPGAEPEQWSATQLISPASGSIYAITPVSEQAARIAASKAQPEPLHTWELPQLEHDQSAESAGPFCADFIHDNDDEFDLPPRQCGQPAEWDEDGYRCAEHARRRVLNRK